MRGLGGVIAVVGLIWIAVAFNMSTSVEVGGRSFGSGEFSVHVPRQQVHNLDLAERRRTHILIGGVLVVVGTILFGFGAVRRAADPAPSADTQKCPFCAELVKAEAKVCKHCGRDLPAASRKAADVHGGPDSLHGAAWSGNLAMVSLLIRQGVDVNRRNAEGRTALELARARGDKQIVHLLKANGATDSES